MTQELSAFEPLRAEATELVAPIFTLVVTDSGTNALALDHLKKIKFLRDKLDGKRVDAVKPMNDTVKAINSRAREIDQPLDQAEKHLRSTMRDFATKEELRVATERARIAEEQRLARVKADAEAKALADEKREREQVRDMFGASEPDPVFDTKIEEQKQVAQLAEKRLEQAIKAAGASRLKNTRKVLKYRITSVDQIPRSLMMPDDRQIAYTIAEGNRNIPGIEVYEEIVIVAR